MRAPIRIGAGLLVLAGAVTAPAGAQDDSVLTRPIAAPTWMLDEQKAALLDDLSRHGTGAAGD